ncbi:16S rRNA (guanine527-N7)-methyltransferase [Roseovarius azorensis]|uniref:Ribosomal RNA small subunit methyltransferase G n=1 Tax=Roseovarius azorensis TaxID=1287727 RepID=A0A1H7KB92_9RHOB|nr:16S rRNA (guanine(527)-N(7))-methyltransferase RsmG [Roseovarius azorensis]SEK83750.1 16S rRNA (guanine527-N7)-methyltransferase [Roseovarius azorensis]
MTGLADVSRETIDRLKIYGDLLQKWNPRINLVSRATLDHLWSRHIEDSAQIYDLAPHPVAHWVDLGSGGGFPGLVVAIMGAADRSPSRTTLIESDARKSAFLRTVIRETGANATVITARIEDIPPLSADVISARALADLDALLTYTERHLASGGSAIFLKGATWKKELSEVQSKWKFDYRLDKSRTETGPVILTITGVARA